MRLANKRKKKMNHLQKYELVKQANISNILKKLPDAAADLADFKTQGAVMGAIPGAIGGGTVGGLGNMWLADNGTKLEQLLGLAPSELEQFLRGGAVGAGVGAVGGGGLGFLVGNKADNIIKQLIQLIPGLGK